MRIMTFIIYFCFLWSSCLFAFDKMPPVAKRMVVEEISQFYVVDYLPPFKIDLTSDQAALSMVKEPERSAISYICSQAQGNIDWYLSCMNYDFRASFLESMNAEGITIDNVSRLVKSTFENTDVILKTLIIRDDYYIIQYTKLKNPGGELAGTGYVAVRFQANSLEGWKVEDISNDLVYKNWQFAGTSLTISK